MTIIVDIQQYLVEYPIKINGYIQVMANYRKMRYLLFILTLLFVLTGCKKNDNKNKNNSIPNSKQYSPLNPGENEALINADKSILPYDVLANPTKYLNKLVIWTGIVDTIIVFKPNNEIIVIDFYLQHRYYDFIEDFNIQKERMFVSPYGEGDYVFRQTMDGKAPLDKIKEILPKTIFKECFLFTYGEVAFVHDSIPVLFFKNFRIVFPENYATNIFSYKVARDHSNKVILSKDGFPNLTEFHQLKIVKRGRNQIGSRLKNSKY